MDKSKRILFLSFYYKPDLCAGSFRASALIDSFLKEDTSNIVMDVVTTMPNRYNTYEVSAKEEEIIENVVINRIDIPVHESGFLDQAKSFRTYFFKALKLTKNNEYDLILATSSRLFTAFLGAYISSKKKTPLYLDIRDIFTDTMNDVLKNIFLKNLVLPIFKRIEKYTFSKAKWINLVSEGFRPYFEERYKTNYSFYTNGIDPEFLKVDFSKLNFTEKKIITYAGNIGEGQGLHDILPASAIALEDDYEFWVIGDGGIKNKFVAEVEKRGITNIKFIPPVNRESLMEYYKKSDFLFLHLNNYNAFEKVLPSKIFEYAATGKPIIAGVAGYSASFISKYLPKSVLFNPCDVSSFVSQLKEFNSYDIDLKDFKFKFSRASIMKDMISDIVNIVNIKE